MPRLSQVPRDQADSSVLPFYDALFGKGRDPVAEPGTATGTPGNWWTVFAHVPDCLLHMVAGFEFYRDKKRKISPRLRELVRPEQALPEAASSYSLSTVKRCGQPSSLRRKSKPLHTGHRPICLMMWSGQFWPIPMTWCYKAVASVTAPLQHCSLT